MLHFRCMNLWFNTWAWLIYFALNIYLRSSSHLPRTLVEYKRGRSNQPALLNQDWIEALRLFVDRIYRSGAFNGTTITSASIMICIIDFLHVHDFWQDTILLETLCKGFIEVLESQESSNCWFCVCILKSNSVARIGAGFLLRFRSRRGVGSPVLSCINNQQTNVEKYGYKAKGGKGDGCILEFASTACCSNGSW